MPFVGLDLHKQVIEAAIVDDDGKLVHKSRFAATREALLAFAKRWLNRDCSVVVEATTNTWPVVDVLDPLVREVRAVPPSRHNSARTASASAGEPEMLYHDARCASTGMGDSITEAQSGVEKQLTRS
jgi:hypothetical protein